MRGTRRPCGIDEIVMERLLYVLHDFVDVVSWLVTERSDTRGCLANYLVMARSEGRRDILTQEANNSSFVSIRQGHLPLTLSLGSTS
jgi:hypothetical protein